MVCVTLDTRYGPLCLEPAPCTSTIVCARTTLHKRLKLMEQLARINHSDSFSAALLRSCARPSLSAGFGLLLACCRHLSVTCTNDFSPSLNCPDSSTAGSVLFFVLLSRFLPTTLVGTSVFHPMLNSSILFRSLSSPLIRSVNTGFPFNGNSFTLAVSFPCSSYP